MQQLFPAIWRKENGYDSEPAPLLLLLASLGGSPALGLLGCVLCGFSVGIMWPGTISITSGAIPMGGTAMFALLAMAGDLGGSIGPYVVGLVTQSA